MTNLGSDSVSAPSRAATSASGRSHWSARLQRNGVYAALAGMLHAHPRIAGILMVGVPVLWVVVWNLLPLIEMARISFLDEYPVRITREAVITAEHYVTLLTDPIAYRPFLRTMAFALSVVVGSFLVALPIAYFLAKRVPGSWQIRLLILVTVPSWVSEIIRAFSQILLYASNGAINIVLQWTGLTSRPIQFLYNWFAVGGGTLYVTVLFMLVPLYAAIEKIPNQVLEAASDLGANKLQRFLRVTLPLIRDGIATGTVLVFLISTGIYTVPVLLSGPDTNLFAQVIAAQFYESNLAWPRGAAFSIGMFVTALLVAALLNFLIRPRRRSRT